MSDKKKSTKVLSLIYLKLHYKIIYLYHLVVISSTMRFNIFKGVKYRRVINTKPSECLLYI